MNIYCTEEFFKEYNKLLKKKSYNKLDQDLISYFFENDIDQISTGINLNQDQEKPFIKKRISGSGGFRIYFYLIISDQKAYLTFVHPKTGSIGSDNLKKESIARLQKEILQNIKSNDLYKLTVKVTELETQNDKKINKALNFKKLKIKKALASK